MNATQLQNMRVNAIIKKNNAKAKEAIEAILNMLPDEPRSYDTSDDPGFWRCGNMILCPSEAECEFVACFFEDVLSEYSSIRISTGYFDPFDVEDEKDNLTGFFYIEFSE
jgi:hypothetical protein